MLGVSGMRVFRHFENGESGLFWPFSKFAYYVSVLMGTIGPLFKGGLSILGTKWAKHTIT